MKFEEMKILNYMYDMEHTFTQEDYENSMKLKEMIEKTRDNTRPKIGDTIKYTNKIGNYYNNAILEDCWGKKEICEEPYVPFVQYVDMEENDVTLSTSGGGFVTGFDIGKFKYIGTEQRLFQDWGHCGPCGNGAVKFYVKVNVWEYQENNRYGEYSTKEYDKLTFRHLEKATDMGYTILGNGIAFRNEEDYNAYLKTYRAKVFKENDSDIVFLYKEKQYYITKEEWDNITHAQIDTRLINGGITKVKVVYNDKEKEIKTYRYENGGKLDLKPYILNREV